MMTNGKKFQSPRKMDEEGEKLADRLKTCRHKLGWRQEEMAARLEISLSTYIRWERYGPPTTQAHRGYVRMMLRKLQGDIKYRVRYAKKTQEKRANARLVLAADE